MTERKRRFSAGFGVFSLLLMLFLVVVVVGGVLLNQHLRARCAEEERRLLDLRRETAAMERHLERTSALLELYKSALSRLDAYVLQFPRDRVGFFSAVESELTKYNVEVKRIAPASAMVSGRTAVTVEFEGPYYTILKAMADWRAMPVMVRMGSLSLSFSDNKGHVTGSTLLETVLEGEGER
ncbi:hypothetical protein [Aminiphilus circumscriptus]|uniref:hypothetical protein n=1 Tax=Aminiphilus circumscriptus TaxID=290732 RepID=UPI000492768E|nr:hypothetical protein [Aminiphilus circumscriptus]